MNSVKWVPKLRFPGFGGEWQQGKLGTFLTIKHGKPQHDVEVTSGGYPILASGGEIGRASKPLYSKPSVLIGRKGTIDQPRYMDTPFWTVDTLFYSELKDDNVARFFYYLFGKVNWRQYNEGSGVPSLSASTISGIDVHAPSIAEQQKIAVFLEVVDGRIEAGEKRLGLLKKYKQGVMQKIFTQQISFMAGKDEGSWQQIRLGDLGKFYRGLTYAANNVQESGNLVLRSSNIQNGLLVLNEDLQFVDKDYSDELQLRQNDIVICMANGSRRLVGKAAVYDGSYNGRITVGAFCSIFRSSSRLATYLLQLPEYEKYLDILLSGTNINNLKNSDLEDLTFSLPESGAEQRKIADFLTTLDDKIKLEESKLERARNFKKSLLQQMFV